MILISIIGFQSAKAQTFYTANSNDIEVAIPNNNVQNTGVFAVNFDNDDRIISCWDGDDPGWAYSIQGMTISRHPFIRLYATDPDVAVYVDGNYLFAVFVYISNGSLFYEHHTLNNGVWTTTVSATVIDYGNCSNPNIDMNGPGQGAIVWSNNYEINAIGINFVNGSLSSNGIKTVPGGGVNSSNHYSAPDVAIGSDGQGNLSVNIVYLNWTYPGYYEFKMGHFPYIDLYNNSIIYPTSITTNAINSSDYYGRPRIASPKVGVAKEDCQAVVEYFNNGNSNHEILGYNYTSNGTIGILTGPTKINSDISQSNNFDPTAAYILNSSDIAVCWTSDANGNSNDLIQKRLHKNTGISMFNYYSVVNLNVSNQQGVSSVCGNISGGLATYLFWDDDKKDCFYKTSSIANQNIKIGRNLSTATIYPNPASNTIQFNLQDFNGLFDYTIYDLSRKVVKQEIRIPNNSKISIEGLPKGLYIIEMIGNEFFSAEKLVIQ